MTPGEARAAVLAGSAVRVIVGPDPEDPTCLHYLDRCFEFDHEPMIYTEAVAGWSAGVKEAVCEPSSEFYVGWLAESSHARIEVWDGVPPQRESPAPVCIAAMQDGPPR